MTYATPLRGDAAPWNNPKLCPMCGMPGTEIVGARKYCGVHADSLRSFLSAHALRKAAEQDSDIL
jgi:hypothetical protein